MMADVHRVSEVVYHCVNEIIGWQEKVVMRRDLWDIDDILHNYFKNNSGLHRMMSGSRREGFFIKSSDEDLMFWRPEDCIIHDLSQARLYNSYTDTIILMDDQYTRPGFVLLRVFSDIVNKYANESLAWFNNYHYISSSLYRQATESCFPCNFTNPVAHGPCTSGFIGNIECDFAFCFASKHWPPQAFYWIKRCIRQHWPSPSVLRNIIQGGCHFVAIGAKISPLEHIEWRLSFSKAEHKLVYNMNHCQFLVYGLFKLFLKEVLNPGIPEDNIVICSYFIKTAVFWEILDCITTEWNIGNFLSCWWNCYKRLMKWVYFGYCPNFFMPQINMFYPKLTGTSQQQLFHQMLDLYNEGLHCLLRCSSIHDKLYSALINPQQPIINSSYFSEYHHDAALHELLFGPFNIIKENEIIQDYAKTLSFLFTKIRSNISQMQRILVYKHIVWTYQCRAFLLQSNRTQKINTEMYIDRKEGMRLMEVATKNGSVTDVLYLAIFHYNEGRYRHTLRLLQKVQAKLYRPHVIYTEMSLHDYIQAMSGNPLSTKLKEAMASEIVVPVYTKIPELRLELRVVQQMKDGVLYISPFVLLHFLSFLCHYHLGCIQQQSLHDLRTLLYIDEGRYIRKWFKDIAWEMLGMCHQLSKHYSQALECYWEARRHFPSGNKIQLAALYRIQAIKRQILILESQH